MAVKCKELVYTPLNAITFRITGGTKSLIPHELNEAIYALEGPDGIILSVDNTTEIKKIKYKVNFINDVFDGKKINKEYTKKEKKKYPGLTRFVDGIQIAGSKVFEFKWIIITK